MNRIVKTGLLGAALTLAIAGCGDNKNGNPGVDGGSTDLASNGSTDMASNGSTDMATSGTFDCTTLATSLCNNVSTCTPDLFKFFYENMTICKDVVTKGCMASATNGDNGVVDPAGCQAALSASCDAYFAAQVTVPAACKRKIGTVADTMPCKYDSQCVATDYCYINGGSTFPGPPTCAGSCQMPITTGSTGCTSDRDCDIDSGVKCVATLMAGPPPTSDGVLACQAVTLGAQGATCIAGTNKQCANGLGCDGNNTCQALLAAGASCDGVNSALCDSRKGHTCKTNPAAAGNICTPRHIVNISAQCGMVGTPAVLQECSIYALCSGGPPTVCNARVTLGQPCVAGPPDNCYPGLVCMAGTCQAPAAPVCM